MTAEPDARARIDVGAKVPREDKKAEALFKRQLTDLGHRGVDLGDMDIAGREGHTRDVVLALQGELHAMLGEANWQAPPAGERGPVDMLNVHCRVARATRWLVELAVVWGMAPDDLYRLCVLESEAEKGGEAKP